MESVWDYVMRRKPIFLGYFALFLVSIFASCSLLNGLMPHKTTKEPSVVQDNPQTIQYDNLILSPQAVASLPFEIVSHEDPATSPHFVSVELAAPSPEEPTAATHERPLENSDDKTGDNQELAQANSSQIAEVPLTSAPRQVSIFRTVLAVLLAVTALTLAGFSLYQAYEYFLPFHPLRPLIEKYLTKNSDEK